MFFYTLQINMFLFLKKHIIKIINKYNKLKIGLFFVYNVFNLFLLYAKNISEMEWIGSTINEMEWIQNY